jgi:ammonia channel protein AmtB
VHFSRNQAIAHAQSGQNPQLKAMGVTIAMAGIATVAIGYALKATIGLRASEEDEELGLDLSDHGERGYHTGELSLGHLEREERPLGAAAAARLEST